MFFSIYCYILMYILLALKKFFEDQTRFQDSAQFKLKSQPTTVYRRRFDTTF